MQVDCIPNRSKNLFLYFAPKSQGYLKLKDVVFPMLQGRLVRGMSFVHETSPYNYKSLEQLWDVEI